MTRNLFAEIVRLLEAGINKQLNSSFLYSPLRLFYGLFKKSNAQMIANIRAMLREDIEKYLSEIENFDQKIFVSQNDWTMPGKDFLRSCYNVGISVLRKKLTLRMAFRAFRDQAVREEIYNYVLEEVGKAALKTMSGLIESKKL